MGTNDDPSIYDPEIFMINMHNFCWSNFSWKVLKSRVTAQIIFDLKISGEQLMGGMQHLV